MQALNPATPKSRLHNRRRKRYNRYPRQRPARSRITNDSESLGGSLYRYASLPFEIASVLLLVAIIGSVMLARTLRQEGSADDVDPEALQEEVGRDPELAKLEPKSE